MRGVNHFVGMGNLTKDLEVRYSYGNKPFCRMTIAANRPIKKQDGTWDNVADFIPVIVWGPMAENCSKYLHKGSPVYVEGRYSSQRFEDRQTGQTRWMTEIVASKVIFLGMGNGRRDRDEEFPSEDEPMDVGAHEPEMSDAPF